MSKTFDKVLEPEPSESYADVASQTQSKRKAAIAEPENPETITAKEVDLKHSTFRDEMNEFRHETHRQLTSIMDLLVVASPTGPKIVGRPWWLKRM